MISFNNRTFPAIEEVLAAITRAEHADDAERDVTDMMLCLDAIITASPRTRGHVLTRKTAVTSFQYTLPDVQDSDEAVIRKALDRILELHTAVPLFGAAVWELTWRLNEETQRHEPLVRLLPTIDVEQRNSEVVIYERTQQGIRKVQPTTGVHLWQTDGAAARGGILRTIIAREILCHQSVVEWANLNARMKGVIAGVIDGDKLSREISALGLKGDAVTEQITAVDKALKDAGNAQAVRMLSGVDLQLKQLVESGAGQSYKEFKAALEADIAVAILGQANTSQLPAGGGSRAALQVLNLIRADIHWDDMKRCARLAEDFLTAYYARNYGSATRCGFEWQYDDENSATEWISVFKGCQELGVPVSKNEFYSRTGLSIPEQDDVLAFASNPFGA